MLRRVDRPVSPELVAFHRREQMQRLKKYFQLGGARPDPTMPQPSDSCLGPRAT
jgi:hypothetical protein